VFGDCCPSGACVAWTGEIGAILGARTRTVAKHLERIYEKLGVETRTAAAAVAFRVARDFKS
jgi:DNA-binding CsgD family transcriptional regulator